MKHSVGDKVKVIKNLYGHDFKIGDIITIEEVNEEDYDCSKDNMTWLLTDEEVVLIE